MDDIEFLEWIYERMIRKHGEYRYYDYMKKFRAIIDAQKTASNSDYAKCPSCGSKEIIKDTTRAMFVNDEFLISVYICTDCDDTYGVHFA